MKIAKRSDKMRNISSCKKPIVHSDHQCHRKSPSLLMIWEIRLFIPCTSVVAKSSAKDFHFSFIVEIKDRHFVKHFLHFILKNCQTFSADARSGDIDDQSIFSILWLAFQLSATFHVCLASLPSCSYQMIESRPNCFRAVLRL